MSTHGVAIVHSEWGDKPLVGIYKHYDGYPEGFGKELQEIAAKYTIGNGIPPNAPEHFANGMGCFAAFLIKELKERPGDVYICDPSENEEYVYHLRKDGDKVVVSEAESWHDYDE